MVAWMCILVGHILSTGRWVAWKDLASCAVRVPGAERRHCYETNMMGDGGEAVQQ